MTTTITPAYTKNLTDPDQLLGLNLWRLERIVLILVRFLAGE